MTLSAFQTTMTFHNLNQFDVEKSETNRCKICDRLSCYLLNERRLQYLNVLSLVPKVKSLNEGRSGWKKKI